MATAVSNVRLNFAYENTTDTRQYQFDVDSDDISNVKAKVKSINASLAASTSGGLDTFFVSDNGDHFASIKAATIITESEDFLNLGGDD